MINFEGFRREVRKFEIDSTVYAHKYRNRFKMNFFATISISIMKLPFISFDKVGSCCCLDRTKSASLTTKSACLDRTKHYSRFAFEIFFYLYLWVLVHNMFSRVGLCTDQLLKLFLKELSKIKKKS